MNAPSRPQPERLSTEQNRTLNNAKYALKLCVREPLRSNFEPWELEGAYAMIAAIVRTMQAKG